jgi:hypothetical protein
VRRLHDLKPPRPTEAYLWYSAYQTRRGARHLLLVPILEIDIAAMRPPPHMRYSPETQRQWRQRLTQAGQDVAVPIIVQTTSATRWCAREQAAHHWQYAEQLHDADRTRQRGFCETCWRALRDGSVASAIAELRTAQPISALTDRDQWTTAVHTRLYVR